MNGLLVARGTRKVYAGGDGQPLEVLRGVDMEVRRGEVVAIIGSSGAGKSTLLHLLGALDTPTAGAIRPNGQDVAGLSTDELAHVRNRVFGFVFQGFNLLKRITAGENVALPMV